MMNEMNVENVRTEEDGGATKPWERQPAEPPDRYYWFRLYLALPIPRKIAKVGRMIGAASTQRTWISKVARQWRWKERAAALDVERAEQLIVRAELQEQLLLDKAFDAQYQGLLETTKALENAEIGAMNREEARKRLTPLSRHQRGLLEMVLLQKGGPAERALEELNEIRLAQLVEQLAQKKAEEMEEELAEKFERFYGADAERE